MDIAKSLFSHRDHEGYVGKEAHNVCILLGNYIKIKLTYCRKEKWS